MQKSNFYQFLLPSFNSLYFSFDPSRPSNFEVKFNKALFVANFTNSPIVIFFANLDKTIRQFSERIKIFFLISWRNTWRLSLEMGLRVILHTNTWREEFDKKIPFFWRPITLDERERSLTMLKKRTLPTSKSRQSITNYNFTKISTFMIN